MLELLEDHFELLSATLNYFCERLYYELAELPADVLGDFLSGGVEANAQVVRHPVEQVLFLRALRPFAKSNLSALIALTRSLEFERVSPGKVLWSRGQSISDVIIPVDGQLRGRGESGDFDIGIGAVLGAVEAGGNLPTWFDLEATGDVGILRGDFGKFVDLFEDNFQIGLDFVATLAQDLLRAITKKRELGEYDPHAVRRNVSKLGVIPVGA